MVEKIAIHSNTISKNAAAGLRKPKNIIDHSALSPSCVKKIISASFFCLLLVVHTIASDTPINKYNVVQTGPKIAFGGEKKGLFSEAYHVGIEERVNTVPKIPANSQRIMAKI